MPFCPQSKEPKISVKIDVINATFQPAKIGNPNGLQITYLKDNKTRNIFVYHKSGKVFWFRIKRCKTTELTGKAAGYERCEVWVGRRACLRVAVGKEAEGSGTVLAYLQESFVAGSRAGALAEWVCVGGAAAEDVLGVCVCEGDAVGPAGGELTVLAADIGLGAAG